MGFLYFLLFAGVATSTAFFGTKYLNENYLPYPQPAPYNLPPTLTPIPSLQPTPTPIPTLEPTITIIPDPTFSSVQPTVKPATPTPSRAPTGVPATPNLGSSIYDLTSVYATHYGVDPNVLRHIAQCESGFNPQSKNPNYDYAGLFQFSPGTWITYRNLMGKNPDPILRYAAEAAIQTAAYILSIGRSSIWPNCTP